VTRPGCSLGHWKNTDVWPYPYTPGTLFTVAGFAPVPFLTDDMLDALNYGGGPGVQGGQMILLRQAAALLNEELYGTPFGPYTSTQQLIDTVNAALASGNKGAMTTLAGTLDWWNNGISRDGTSTSTLCPTIAGSFNTNFVLTRPSSLEICEIPSTVTIYGDISAAGILLKVGGTVHGDMTQTGFNGLWVLEDGSVHGDLDEYGGTTRRHCRDGQR